MTDNDFMLAGDQVWNMAKDGEIRNINFVYVRDLPPFLKQTKNADGNFVITWNQDVPIEKKKYVIQYRVTYEWLSISSAPTSSAHRSAGFTTVNGVSNFTIIIDIRDEDSGGVNYWWIVGAFAAMVAIGAVWYMFNKASDAAHSAGSKKDREREEKAAQRRSDNMDRLRRETDN